MKRKARIWTVLVLAIGAASGHSGEVDNSVEANSLDWRVVNDTVMGGRSSATVRRFDEGVTFSGFLNTNGGGFASMRVGAADMISERSVGIRLKVRGDGRTYTLRLRPRNSRISYWSQFDTTHGEWVEIDLPFSSFWPNWRGRRLNAPPIDGSQIAEMGLMLNDGRDGNFKVEVEWIASYNNGQAYGL